MTVRQLLAQIDSKELAEWMAYHSIDPFGEERADIRAAQIACTIANAAGRPKGKPPFKLRDFLLDFEPKEPQSVESMRLLMRSIASGKR